MTYHTNEIWKRVVAGNPDAWEELVRKYSPLVYAVARRSGLDADDSEDCAQQVWLALYRGRLRLKDPAKLIAWLTSTSRRQAVRIRTRRRRNLDSKEVTDQLVRPDQPDAEIMRLQRRAQLEYALEQMDQRCQDLLRAMFLSDEEISYRDLAERLKIPFNSLGPTRARCLKKLSKILKEIE